MKPATHSTAKRSICCPLMRARNPCRTLVKMRTLAGTAVAVVVVVAAVAVARNKTNINNNACGEENFAARRFTGGLREATDSLFNNRVSIHLYAHVTIVRSTVAKH